MRAPNVFIVGAPKCGTTALSEYLRKNPKVFMSFPKEPCFFCSDMISRVGYHNFEDYRAIFADADESHQAVVEASVHYLRSKVAIPSIVDKYPDAKFIVMVREPLAFLRSWHNQLLFSLSENEKDFAAAWRMQEDRRQGRNLVPGRRDSYILDYEEAARFGGQIQRMLKHVDCGKVLFLKFEDFIKDLRGNYLKVLDFLGVDDDGQTDFLRHNTAHQNKSRLVSQLLRSTYRGLSGINPLKRENSIRRAAKQSIGWLVEKNKTYYSPPAVPDRLATEIRELLRDDILLLAALSDLDVSDYLASITDDLYTGDDPASNLA